MSYQQKIEDAMASLTDIKFVSVGVIDLTKTNLIIFSMEDNELWLAEQNMKAIVCALQEIGTNGYNVRLAGKMMNGLTGLTMTLSASAVMSIDCSADMIDWASIAEDYNVAKGLQ